MTDQRVNVSGPVADLASQAPAQWLAEWPDACVVGQVGQSLDGRVATPSGHSHYINSVASRVFLHQLRAEVDAVVIGAGTALADDPQLTVRHVDGTHPARVVIDPSARVPSDNPVFRDDGCEVIRVVDEQVPMHGCDGHIQALPMAMAERGLDVGGLVEALSARGFARVLVEGGPTTLSRFIQAQALDRLYVMIAPLIIGSGPAGLTLPAIEHLDEALRLPMRSTRLADELLVELDLIGRAATAAR